VAPPTYTPGQVLSYTDCNSWFTPEAAYKTADTSRASTTTRAADPDLTVPVAANAVYDVRCYLSYQSGNTSGIGLNFAFTTPAGVSGRWGAAYRVAGDAGTTTNAGPAGTVDFAWSGTAATGGTWNGPATPGDGHSHSVLIEGTLITAGTAGSLTLAWAQDSSSATNLVIQNGSKLIALRVG